MQVLQPSMRMFVFCAILLIGNIAQGAPVKKERYMRVRCRPDASSANCIEEEGPPFEIPQGEAKGFLPPATSLQRMKTREESGSGIDVGSGTEPDVGSGMDSSIDYSNPFPEYLKKQARQNYALNLREDDFIL